MLFIYLYVFLPVQRVGAYRLGLRDSAHKQRKKIWVWGGRKGNLTARLRIQKLHQAHCMCTWWLVPVTLYPNSPREKLSYLTMCYRAWARSIWRRRRTPYAAFLLTCQSMIRAIHALRFAPSLKPSRSTLGILSGLEADDVKNTWALSMT